MYQILLMTVAVLPVLFILFAVYDRDKDKEPFWILFMLFCAGVLTGYLAYIFESTGFKFAKELFENNNPMYLLMKTVIIVAVIEEFLKYVFLILLTWYRKSFNYRYDAIVYSVFVSLGFALLENILYVNSLGLRTGLIRGLTAVPLHAVTAIFMGVEYGDAKEAHNGNDQKAKRIFLFNALIIPLLIHGIYNFCLLENAPYKKFIFPGYVVVIILAASLKAYQISKQKKKLPTA